MENLLKRKILFLLLAIGVVSVIGGGVALITTRVTIRNVGTIKTVGVGLFQDKNCTTALSSFDWGMTDPGSVRNETVYIRNEGSVEASLYLETKNWEPPEASEYITLSWDYSNQMIKPNESIQVTFFLSVSSKITGITNFNFDITIECG